MSHNKKAVMRDLKVKQKSSPFLELGDFQFFGGMDKKEQELRQNVSDLRDEAKSLMDEGKNDEAKAKLADAKQAKQKLDDYLEFKAEMEDTSLPAVNNNGGQMQQQPGDLDNPISSQDSEEEKAKMYKSAFFKALRGKKLDETEASVMEEFYLQLSEETGEDGGYVVPEDITTTINELKNTVDNLEQYVSVEPVSTNKGARTLERRADSTPFAPLSEYGNPNAMQEMNSPKFDRIPYEIEDYAGFLPVPNDLLNDSDQALERYLRRWIAKKSKATRNSLIIALWNTLAKKDLVDWKGIKTTLNVDLDPAHSQTAAIFTNQSGFNYLDQLEDGNGRPLLQPDPQQPTRKLFDGKAVVVLSNKTLASVDNGDSTFTHPFIVGDMKEAIVLFDRQQLSIDMTKVGGNSWRTNTTEFRAIEREDVKGWDTEAVVYGQITEGTPVV